MSHHPARSLRRVTVVVAAFGVAALLLAAPPLLRRASAAAGELVDLGGGAYFLESGGVSLSVRDGVAQFAVDHPDGGRGSFLLQTEAMVAGAERVSFESGAISIEDEGRRLVIRRSDSVDEIYEPRGGAGIEQLFRIARLPALGEADLVIEASLVTSLEPEVLKNGLGGIGFRRGATQIVTYGGATAIDARGERREGRVTVADGVLRIAIDGAWASKAALPLVIDPLISGTVSLSTSTADQGNIDLAHARTADQYIAVFDERTGTSNQSALPRRIMAARYVLTAGSSPVRFDPANFQVSTSFTDQAFPAVAWSGGTTDKYLVAWIDVATGTVEGALINTALPLVMTPLPGPIFPATTGVVPASVSVGGAEDGSGWLVVVSLQTAAGSPTDVQGVLVSAAGTPGTPFAIAATGMVERDASVSRLAPVGAPYFVAWSQEPSSADIAGRTVSTAGTLGAVLSLAATASAEETPSVAGPTGTGAAREWVVAYAVTLGTNDRDVRAVRTTATTVGATTDIATGTTDDHDPSAGSLGDEYAITFTRGVGSGSTVRGARFDTLLAVREAELQMTTATTHESVVMGRTASADSLEYLVGVSRNFTNSQAPNGIDRDPVLQRFGERVFEVRETSASGALIANGQLAAGTARHFGAQAVTAGATVPLNIVVRNLSTTNALGLSNVQTTSPTEWPVTGFVAGSVAPSGVTQFAVAFDPPAAGNRTGTISFTATMGTFTRTFSFQVAGYGYNQRATFTYRVDMETALPDADLSGVDAVLTLPPFGDVLDTRLTLDIAHTESADLDVFLGAGTAFIDIVTDEGGTSDGFSALLFTDASTVTTLPTVSGPNTGTSKPDSPFSALSFAPLPATWLVNVADDASGDLGTWNFLELQVDIADPVSTSGAQVRALRPTGPPIPPASAASGVRVFPPHKIGDPPVSFIAFIENTGTAALTGVAVPASSSPHFVVAPVTVPFPTTLQPGETAAFEVAFAPTAAGPLTGQISFPHAGPGGPTYTFEVSGYAAFDFVMRAFRVDALEPLPNGGGASVQSTIELPALGDVIDVRLTLDIPHSSSSELDAFLFSPSLTFLDIVTDEGGTSDGFDELLFTDSATVTTLPTVAGPNTGSAQPDDPFSLLFREPVEGAWTLEVADDTTGSSTGTLDHWILELDIAVLSPSPVAGALIRLGSATGPTIVNGSAASGPRAFLPQVFGAAQPQSFTVFVENVGNGDMIGLTAPQSTAPDFRVEVPPSFPAALPPGGTASFDVVFDPQTPGVVTGDIEFTHAGAAALYSFEVSGYGIPVAPVPISVPATGLPATVVDTINILSSIDCPIEGDVLKVTIQGLDIVYDDVSDLDLYLTGPNGSRIVLSNNRPGNASASPPSANFTDVTFDDLAPTEIATVPLGTAMTGAFKPDEPLSTFILTPAKGTWTLEVDDTAIDNDQLTLVGWRLVLEVASSFPQLVIFDMTTGAVVQAGAAIDFGTETIGTIPTPHPLELRNVGPGSIVLSSAALGGASPSDFTLATPPLPVTITNAAPETFFLAFDPISPGPVSASISIGHNAVTTTATPYSFGLEGLAFAGSTVTSTAVVTAIPDGNVAGVESPLFVAAAGDLDFVRVTVDIDHPRTSDLTITLVHPDGTEVALAERHGLGADFSGTVFDDLAPVPIGSGVNPFLGSFRPQDPLAATLGGKEVNGTWKLRVVDGFGADEGDLLGWTLEVGFTSSSLMQVREGSPAGAVIRHAQPPTGSLAFGDVALDGAALASVQVSITNSGKERLNVTAIDVLGGAGAFSIGAGFGGAIDPGQSESFAILFDPNVLGPVAATISVSHDSPLAPNPFEFGVSGNAVGAEIEVTDVTTGAVLSGGTATMDFGTQSVTAGASSFKYIKIANTGLSTLTLGQPALGGLNPGEFRLDLGSFATSVPAAGSVRIGIAFDPGVVAARAATLSFSHDGEGEPDPFVLALAGTGTRANLQNGGRSGGGGGGGCTAAPAGADASLPLVAALALLGLAFRRGRAALPAAAAIVLLASGAMARAEEDGVIQPSTPEGVVVELAAGDSGSPFSIDPASGRVSATTGRVVLEAGPTGAVRFEAELRSASGAPRDFGWRLIGFGGGPSWIDLGTRPAAVTLDKATVLAIRRGADAPEEVYASRSDGFEQSFRFHSLPALGGGDLVVEGAVATDLALEVEGDGWGGIAFRGASGVVLRYGAATAIDGDGRRTPVRIEAAGSRIRLIVGGAWVAQAALPLVIDPVIGAVIPVSTAPEREVDADVAYSIASDHYIVVWVDETASPRRILGKRLKADGSLVQPGDVPFVIASNATTANMSAPSVAWLGGGNNRYLVAWVDRTANEVRGALVTDIEAAGGPTVTLIATPIGVRHTPDAAINNVSVGGRDEPGGNWLVAWDTTPTSGANGEVRGNLVASTGAIVSTTLATTTPISTLSTRERNPSVAKHALPGKDWFIAYVNETTTTNTNYDIRANTVTPAGVRNSSSISVDTTSTNFDDRPSVAGTDPYAVAYERSAALGGDRDLRVRLVVGRTVQSSPIITVTSTTVDDAEFAVAAAGGEFLVTWTRRATPTSPDRNIRGIRLDSALGITENIMDFSSDNVSSKPAAAGRAIPDGVLGDFLAVWETVGVATESDIAARRGGATPAPVLAAATANGTIIPSGASGPDSAYCGAFEVTATAALAPLVLRNVGTADGTPSNFASSNIDGDFAIDPGAIPASVPAGGRVPFPLLVDPVTTGLKTTTVSFDFAPTAGGSTSSVAFDAKAVGFDGSMPLTSIVQTTATPNNTITNTQAITSSILVPPVGPMVGMRVLVDITHTFDDDLEISIFAPDGTEFRLAHDRGSDSDGFRCTFSDTGADVVPDTISPSLPPPGFQGVFKPQDAFKPLLFTEPTGTWTLEVVDDASGDNGTLNSWTLEFDTAPIPPPAGILLFEGVQGGTLIISGSAPSSARRFGLVPIGTANPPSLTIVLENNGQGILRPANLRSTSPHYRIVGGLPPSIAPSAVASFAVVFDPQAGGLLPGTIAFDHNAPGGVAPNPFEINLEGFGLTNPPLDLLLRATGIPIGVPDNGEGKSTVFVPAPGQVLEVRLTGLHIVHTFDADLDIFLISPAGTTIELSTDNGGSSNDYIDTTFDDAAATPITHGLAPFTGTFAPEQPLSTFFGEDAFGVWTLRVADDVRSDVGTVQGWNLEITVSSAAEGAVIVREAVSTAVVPPGVVSAEGVDLGHAAIGGLPSTLDLEIFNAGDTDVVVDPVRLDGQNAADFALAASSSPLTLAAGDVASFQLIFDPVLAGPLEAVVEIDYTPAGGVLATYAFGARGLGLTQPLVTAHTGFVFITIPSANLTGVEVPLNVAATGAIDFLTVNMDIVHPFDEDLDVFLVHPDGTRVELTSDNGADEDDYLGTIFDDRAPTPVHLGTGPFPGRYRPEEPLAKLYGKEAAGTWKLLVVDDAGTTSGNVSGWGLELGLSPSPVLVVHEGAVGGPTIAPGQPASGSLAFAPRAIGSGASAAATVTIENTGPGALFVSPADLVLTGSDAGEFVLDKSSFNGNIQPGLSQSFTIAFRPTTAGAKSAEVSFTHNAPVSPLPFTFEVSGIGLGPEVVLRPSGSATSVPAGGTLDVGLQAVNKGPSAPFVVEIANPGPVALSIASGPALGGPNAAQFALDTTGFSATVPAGGTTRFALTFDPGAQGVHTATLTFEHDSADAPSPFLVTVIGTGAAPAVRSGGGGGGGGGCSAGASRDGGMPLAVVGLALGVVLARRRRPAYRAQAPGEEAAVGAPVSRSDGKEGGRFVMRYRVALVALLTGTTAGCSGGSSGGGGSFSKKPLVISTTVLADGIEGIAYSATIQASGGQGTIAWDVASGTLPAGLALTPNGWQATIDGVPAAAGTFPFTVKVSDSPGTLTTAPFTITIAPALSISTTSVASATENVAYTATITAQDGSGSGYVWSISTGSLPPGLSIGASGTPSTTISGTPTDPGTFDFTVRVEDSAGGVATRLYQMVVGEGIAIATTSLQSAIEGSVYGQAVIGTGGAGSYSWSIAAGALPPGLTLGATGTPATSISGTPTTLGTFNFSIRVTDSSGQSAASSLSIVVGPRLAVTTQSLPVATQTNSYSTSIAASGGSGTSYTWSVVSGSLPPGMALAGSGTPSTTLSGAPTASGTFNFVVRVTDSRGGFDSQALTLVVNPRLDIAPVAIPLGVEGDPYSQTLTGSGGSGAGYSWSITSGSLPGGLSLTSGTPSATLAGTLAASIAGTYNFTVTVTDSVLGTGSRAYTLTIRPPLAIATTSLSSGIVPISYTQSITATGGDGTFSWALDSGTLPPGLVLGSTSSATATLSGTPATAGSFTFTLRVEDGAGHVALQQYTVNVAPRLEITTTALALPVVGSTYDQTIASTGGSGAGHSWSVTAGALPDGLALGSTSAASATLSGTPTVAGTFGFTLQVTDSSGGSDTHDYTLTVNPKLDIATATLPGGVLNGPYDQPITAAGGSGAGYQWAVTAGALPDGLSLETSGTPSTRLFGTPTAIGTFDFTVQLTDSFGKTATRNFQIVVSNVLAISTTDLARGVNGRAYSQTISAGGGSGTGYTWALAAGSDPLPTGLTLGGSGTPSTTLSGTPSVDGIFDLIIQVTDSNLDTATKDLTLTINPPLEVTTQTLPDALEEAAYTQTLQATGGTLSGYTWALAPASAALPAGLTLGTDGTISGTPTVSGTFVFTVRVTDADAVFDDGDVMLVIVASVEIATTTLPIGIDGTAYDQTISTQFGSGAGYTWAVTGGSLPPGLALGTVAGTSTTLSGTPTQAGTFGFTVTVTDGASTDDQDFSVEIKPALEIATSIAPKATINEAYTFAIASAGGSGQSSYTWSIAEGSLPAGLSLSTTPGFTTTISGTPAALGVSLFTLKVTDPAGAEATRRFTISVRSAFKWVVAASDERSNSDDIEPILYDVSNPAAPAAPASAHQAWPAGADASTSAFALSPDGTKLAFLADIAIDAQMQLWVTDLTAGPPFTAVQVSVVDPGFVGAMLDLADVSDFVWSPDSKKIAFRADNHTDGVNELYVVDVSNPAAPSAPARVSVGIISTGGVVSQEFGYEFSPDSKLLAFIGSLEALSVDELYVVDVTRAHPYVDQTAPFAGRMKVSTRGSGSTVDDTFGMRWAPQFPGRLIWVGNEEAGITNVHMADIAATGSGPVAGPVRRLSNAAGTNATGDVSSTDELVMPSPDGTKVFYVADQDLEGAMELYVVDISGSLPAAPVRLNPAYTANTQTVVWPIWSPNSDAICYIADQDANGVHELYLVELDSPGTSTKLSGTMVTNGDVAGLSPPRPEIYEHPLQTEEFMWSPDGLKIAYIADQNTDSMTELFLFDLRNNQRTTLNPSPLPGTGTTGGDVLNFTWSNDGQKLVYLADQVAGADNFYEAWVVDVSTTVPGTPQRINRTPLPTSGDVESTTEPELWWSRDSTHVFYRADDFSLFDNVTELSMVNVSTFTVTALSNCRAFANNADVAGFKVQE